MASIHQILAPVLQSQHKWAWCASFSSQGVPWAHIPVLQNAAAFGASSSLSSHTTAALPGTNSSLELMEFNPACFQYLSQTIYRKDKYLADFCHCYNVIPHNLHIPLVGKTLSWSSTKELQYILHVLSH